MRRSAAYAFIGLAALTACSKSPAPPLAASAASAPAAAPSAKLPSPAALFARPQRKPGLWQVSITTSSGMGMTLGGDVCVGPDTDKSSSFADSPMSSKACSGSQFHPTAGGIEFDSTCKVQDRTVVSHGVATGDFSSSYAVDVTTHMDPPIPGMHGDSKTHMEAHWLGACKPGQVPGHMTMKMPGHMSMKMGAPPPG